MMNTPKNNHRHIHYIDHGIQKWLLAALVTMEIMLVVIAMWMLYNTLSEAIDQEMYQVHFAGHLSAFSHLLNEGMKMLGIVLLVNLVALVVADLIWAYWVNGILRNLMALMDASLHLDFSKKNHIPCNHTVLVHAVAWRDAELLRIEGLRHDIHTLPSALPATEKEREETAAILKKIMVRPPAA